MTLRVAGIVANAVPAGSPWEGIDRRTLKVLATAVGEIDILVRPAAIRRKAVAACPVLVPTIRFVVAAAVVFIVRVLLSVFIVRPLDEQVGTWAMKVSGTIHTFIYIYIQRRTPNDPVRT
jgi:hypothetical protein